MPNLQLRRIPALLLGGLLLATPVFAQTAIPPVSIGAGARTSYNHIGKQGAIGSQPEVGSSDRFLLDSARIYINGTVTPIIKFAFNTEYDGFDDKIRVMDAIARFETSDKLNFWAGRHLPPSDRANLHGPYYSHEWGTYIDGIQDGYPSTVVGRADGITYWGDFGKAKASFGVFDGPNTTGGAKPLVAGRFQYSFLEPEKGYYVNGTYYGGKKILSLAGAFQNQSGNTASTADLLFETKGAGYLSVQSEYSYYDKLGGYNPSYALSRGAFIMASYMFGKPVGMGKFEILAKYAEAKFDKGGALNPYYSQKTSEADLTYVIKEFNARITSFYINKNYSAVKSDAWTYGLGLQIQM